MGGSGADARRRVVLSIYDDLDNPHYAGGGPAVVARVAQRLVAEGYAVTVYCGSYRGAVSGDRGGVRYVHLPVGWAGPRGGQILFWLLLPLVALVVRPAVWIESLTPPVSASLVPLTARCPVVGLVQMLCGADMQRRYHLPFEAIERRGLALYRHYVTLNDVDADLVAAAGPRATVRVIPNGVELPERATPATGMVLLYLGRIDVEQKGLDLLLEALPDGGSLEIAGSGTAAEEAKLAALVDGDPRVRMLGRVQGAAKEAALARCAVVVVPSRYETFSLTALEAMSHGRPVIHFDLPRLAWIGREGGIAVPSFSVPHLHDAMARMLADREGRVAMGRAARRHSLGYDRRITEERYVDLVAGLTG
ncbi:glycosyltransferase family 4 protein [Actinomycetospora sp. OC33-EN08]|uniref:Glycosyltransferase family 4 protein n=1 Tax=Actinomycetospora aurantiaca TaxID=3129233 RepID=A0ABU8MR54_9PSEU